MATNNATNTSQPITVTQGGTGVATLGSTQVLVGAGTGNVASSANFTFNTGTSQMALAGNALFSGPTPWADVVAYGADPTGAADSTTAIQNAVNSFATGGIVWFPIGTYKITGTITITTPHIRFCGASRTDCVISTTNTTLDMFLCNQWYIGFENLTFQASAANTKTAGYAINMADTYNYNYVWRCDFVNLWSGVLMAGHLCYIDDVQFRTFSNAAVNGSWITLTASHDRWIRKVVGDNGSNLTGFSGVRVTQTASLLMDSCSLVHATTCLDLAPTVGLTVPSIEVVNTFFDTSTFGMQVSGAGTVARCKFTNCWFSSHTSDGVRLNASNATGITFVNCDFYGNANGINALAATDWCVMDSRFAGNTTTGILTTAGAAHSFMIIGNTIGATSLFGANALGINVQAGTYASYRVCDNIGFDSNTTKGITDSGSVTGQGQKDVSNNLGATLLGGISASTANTGAINTTETIIAGGVNTAVIPANSLQIGTTFRFTVFGTCTATVANVSTFRIRMGTAGTTGDTLIATAATQASAAAGTNIPFWVDCMFTVRTIGGAGTIVGSLRLLNEPPAAATVATALTGISVIPVQVIQLTPAAINTTTANYIEMTYQTAAATTTSTFQNGIIEIVKC